MKRANEKNGLNYHSKALKIAMLSIHSSPIGALGTKDTGGMSVYVRETAKELGKKGHHIDIFTQHNIGKHDPVIDLYDNVRLVHLPGGTVQNMAKSSLYESLPRLIHELESYRKKENITYDVIHSHYWLSGLLGLKLRTVWNACHVITFHTIGAVKNATCPAENASELRVENEKKLANECDQIIVSSKTDKEYLVRYCGAPPNKIRIVPCGVDQDLFRPLDNSSARQDLSFSLEDIILLYVGRYTPVKGLDRLFETVSCLMHLPRLRLVLVGGDGESSLMLKQLQSKAKTLQIENRLIFVGRVDQKNLPAYYSAADVLAITSYYESFGLVALEALSCGTPVVTTSVGAMKEIVKNSATGYVAKDANPQHFAELIENTLLTQKQNGLSSLEIRSSVSEFTWARSASLLLDAYRPAPRFKSKNIYKKKEVIQFGQ